MSTFEFKSYASQFKKEIVAARKKAGAKVGTKIVQERRKAIGAVSSRRKKAVRRIVGRDGTLVIMDHAPLAEIQETGGTISGKSGPLFIRDRRRGPQPGEKVFITKTGLVMAVKPWIKNLKNRTNSRGQENKRPRLVGIFKRSVSIHRLPDSAQLDRIAAKHLDEYITEVDSNLFKGMR